MDRERIRVLLVEDDANDAKIIARVLGRCAQPSCDWMRVGELSAAGALLQSGIVDVVLLDLSLPDCRGLAGLRELASKAPRVPIVVLTEREDQAVAIEAIRNGAQDYLVKGENDPLRLHRSLCYAIERKAFEARLAERAHFDQLTGLVNRALFEDRLEHAIARARRVQSRIALLFIDLDGFKAINDSLGHATGDEVLRFVAEKLRCCVRESESVARLGGDEFTILLDPIDDAAAAAVAAGRIISAMKVPLSIDGQRVEVTASIGVALFPDHCGDSETLLRHADSAMFRAKARGRNRFQMHAF